MTARDPCDLGGVRFFAASKCWMLDIMESFFIATTHTPFVLEKNQAKKPRAPSWFNREILHSEVKPSYAGDLSRPQTRPRVSNPKKVAEVSGIPPAICREIHRFL